MKLPRFTVLTLLLITTIVGMTIGFRFQRIENAKLEHQISQLVDELGIMQITNPDLIYSRQLAYRSPGLIRYRIFLPDDHNIRYLIGVTKLLSDGKPDLEIMNFQNGTAASLDPLAADNSNCC